MHNNSPVLKLTGGLMEKPPKPIKYSQSNSNHGYYKPSHTVTSSMARGSFEPSIPNIRTQTTTSTTKTFLNNSLQAVQQKMEDLLPTSQTSTFSSSLITKELPLLSRISNEISANTANTVKVLKRRLSLN